MLKSEKRAWVSDFKNKLAQIDGVPAAVVVAANGLDAARYEQIRRCLHGGPVWVRVIKNRLAQIAFEGTGFSSLSKDLKGSNFVLVGGDVIEVAKAANKILKDNKDFVQIVAGVDNNASLTPAEVLKIADLPTLDEARAQLVWLLSSVLSSFVYVLGQVGEKSGEGVSKDDGQA